MDLREFILVLRKSWALILVLMLASTGVSAAWSLSRTPEYRATTRLFVSVRTGDSSAGELTQGSNYARQAVASYISVVSSSIVMDRVASQLDIQKSSQDLAKQVTAESPAETVLIDINVVDPDPESAQQIANTTSVVFSDVVSNQLEASDSDGMSRVQVEVIEPARLPEFPVSPDVKRDLFLGLLIGLGLGVAIAVLRSELDTRVRTKEDITAITKLPIVGAIAKDLDSEKRPIIALEDPKNPLVESYRALRTNLRYLDVENDQRSIVLTSAGPGEGKSTTAVNLAIVMADAGARVVLIDADLRKPKVAMMLGIEGSVGLSDLLIARVNLEDALQQWGRKQLFVLPSGRIPPNPSELLGSSAMGKILETLSAHFDYIIIDSPPALAVTDAAILSTRTGGAVVVSAAGKTRKAELEDAFETLENVDGHVLGVVATMVPTKGPNAYNYGAYSYKSYSESNS